MAGRSNLRHTAPRGDMGLRLGRLEELVGATESPLMGGVIPTRLSVLVAVQ